MLSYMLIHFCLSTCSVNPDNPTEQAIRESIIGNRIKIQSGYFELKFSGHVMIANGKQLQQSNAPSRLNIWLDGKRIRGDRYRQYPNGYKDSLGRTEYREISCFTDKDHIWWDDSEGKGKSGLAISITSISKVTNPSIVKVIDPRTLGMAPVAMPNLVHYDLDTYISNGALTEAPIVNDMFVNGDKMYKITYKWRNGTIVVVTVSPSHGNNIISIESSRINKANSKSIVSRVVNSYELYVNESDKKQIWYVKKSVYSKHIDSILSEQLECIVDKAVINKVPDTSAFDLIGMDITPGRLIQQIPRPAGNEQMWDGKSIVTIDSVGQRKNEPVSSTSSFFFYLTVVFCALACLCSVFMVYRKQANI